MPNVLKNFWKWSLGIPAKDNPINDPTGVKCTNSQSNTNSSVSYLGFNNGGISERTCKVPAGKALFIPVMQVETEPLAKGTYIIHFKSSLLCQETGCSDPNFTRYQIYHNCTVDI
jgi:hypothetical protein